MPFSVTISDLAAAGLSAETYAAQVEEYRQARLAHRFTVNVPAPSAPAFIEAAVRRVPQSGAPDDFVADFEIIDDRLPAPSLEERRRSLIADISAEEGRRLDALMPSGKLRLLQMQATLAAKKAPPDRSPEEADALARFEHVMARMEAITLHAATLMAAVDDLAEGEIDAFHIAGWPE